MLDPNRALSLGVPTKVVDNLITGLSGTDNSRIFSIINSMAGKSEVVCNVIGTFSVLNGNIEQSINAADAVPTWITLVAFNFVSDPVVIFDATPGVCYRFNIVNITNAGLTTPPYIYATHR